MGARVPSEKARDILIFKDTNYETTFGKRLSLGWKWVANGWISELPWTMNFASLSQGQDVKSRALVACATGCVSANCSEISFLT